MTTIKAFGYFLAASLVSLNVWASLPVRFLEVSPGIYRSGQPSASEMQDLKKLGIKTILNLNNEEDSIRMESKAAKKLGIVFIDHGMSGFWSPDEDQVNASLAILNDPNNYPILVHCKHGEDRTGLIIGLHRVYAEGWTANDAYSEMLELGFHRTLIFLDRYFKAVTGLDD